MTFKPFTSKSLIKSACDLLLGCPPDCAVTEKIKDKIKNASVKIRLTSDL
jgi:hypothetical protein